VLPDKWDRSVITAASESEQSLYDRLPGAGTTGPLPTKQVFMASISSETFMTIEFILRMC
jgi:hypothetical protein